MFDSENPKLSETEKVHLIGLLQLMESAYDEDIWNNMAVVTFDNGGNFYGVHHLVTLTFSISLLLHCL